MSLKRNKKCGSNCPECGVFVCAGFQAYLAGHNVNVPEHAREHACDPQFLIRSERATNAAHRRDPDTEEAREPTLLSWLKEGYSMLAMSDDEYEYAESGRHRHKGRYKEDDPEY